MKTAKKSLKKYQSNKDTGQTGKTDSSMAKNMLNAIRNFQAQGDSTKNMKFQGGKFDVDPRDPRIDGKYGDNTIRNRKKGGSVTKAKKFAALAPPYNKATAADRIAGAKKSKSSKKK